MSARTQGSLAAVAFLAAATALSPADQSKGESQKVSACRDSDGELYSPGAIVQVHGQLMRCVVGPHWVPFDQTAQAPEPSVLDVSGEDFTALQEAAILSAFRSGPLPHLTCDTVLNSERQPPDLLSVPSDEATLAIFWTPVCPPCKPLLARLANLAASKPPKLSFLGVVQASDPDFDPPGDWPLLRVKGILAQCDVGFPTCVHASNETSKAWQAGGVPLLLLFSEQGMQRVALGEKSAGRLIDDLAARHGVSD